MTVNLFFLAAYSVFAAGLGLAAVLDKMIAWWINA